MPEFDAVKDSGARRQFDTGAVRDVAAGKGRYDLLPPLALKRIAKHFENGAVKYGDNNWTRGIPLKCFADSALRHIFTWLSGADDEDHLAAAAWNLLCLIETEERICLGQRSPELSHGLAWRPGTEAPRDQ